MSDIDRDVLISRMIDAEASPEDWAMFKAIAAREPGVWAELADAQQDRAELAESLARAVAIADAVEAPVECVMGERVSARARVAFAWTGWGVAALLAFGAVVGPSLGVRNPFETGVHSASLGPDVFRIASPEDAVKVYLDKGQESGDVLGELPDRLLVRSTPSGDGYEVIYVRQFIERTVVRDMYSLGVDELGRPVPVRYSPSTTNPTQTESPSRTW